MTYKQAEESVYGGKPIELYSFFRTGASWRYTSGEEDLEVDSFNYIAKPISRAAIEQTSETVKNALNIKCAASIPVIDEFRTGIPSSVTTMEIRRFHYGINEFVTIWRGRIVNVSFGDREAEIRCESIFTSLLRPVLRRFYQTNCPHVLYGPECRVSRAGFAVETSLAGVVGSTLTAAGFGLKPDGWFQGGYIDWAEGTELQRRFIMSHTADAVVITRPFVNMPADANVTAYPGCDHSFVTCGTKFTNDINYGGQPFYPKKNPFSGVQIF